jgi:hypothetical protein
MPTTKGITIESPAQMRSVAYCQNVLDQAKIQLRVEESTLTKIKSSAGTTFADHEIQEFILSAARSAVANAEHALGIAAEEESQRNQAVFIQHEWLTRCQDVSLAASKLEKLKIEGTNLYGCRPDDLQVLRVNLNQALYRKHQFQTQYPFVKEPNHVEAKL